jgi:type II secretory pathway pseudopilin PulG
VKQRLASEAGITLVELVFVLLLLGIIMGGLAGVFVGGLRASSDSESRLSSQENVRVAIDRLEFEVRCASGATVGGSGANVVLTLPSECSHATGTYTWCVANGTLWRYSGSACTGSGQGFAANVTTATPFSLVATSGLLPQLQIALSVDSQTSIADSVSVNDLITLRNAARTA